MGGGGGGGTPVLEMILQQLVMDFMDYSISGRKRHAGLGMIKSEPVILVLLRTGGWRRW